MSDDLDSAPVLRVVSGDPTSEELAALVVALCGRAGPAGSNEESSAPSAWSDPVRLVRRPVHPAPYGWRRSGVPG